jgi:hypothetical protein
MKLIILLIILYPFFIFPQSKNEPYYISIDLAGGFSRYFTSMDFEDLNKNGYDGTIRIMWHPEHLLSVGIETGYQHLYNIKRKFDPDDFDETHLNINLASVPISLLFSMKIFPKTFPGLRLNGGSGVSIVYSSGELFNDKFNNSQIMVNYIISLNYLYQFSNRISAGGELKFTHLSKLEDSSVAVQLLLSYKFISW